MLILILVRSYSNTQSLTYIVSGSIRWYLWLRRIAILNKQAQFKVNIRTSLHVFFSFLAIFCFFSPLTRRIVGVWKSCFQPFKRTINKSLKRNSYPSIGIEIVNYIDKKLCTRSGYTYFLLFFWKIFKKKNLGKPPSSFYIYNVSNPMKLIMWRRRIPWLELS